MKRLRCYPGTHIPVKAAALWRDDMKFHANIMTKYDRTFGMPMFLAIPEMRVGWSGRTRNGFEIRGLLDDGTTLLLNPTTLQRMNITWRDVQKPVPGLHPWVLTNPDLTIPVVPERFRYYKTEGEFRHDCETWTRRPLKWR